MQRLALLTVALAATAACAGNDRFTTSAEEYDDLAVTLASTIRPPSGGHGELVAMSDVVALASGRALDAFTFDEHGHHGEHAGLAYDYALACGEIGCDVRASWRGELAEPYLTLAVDRAGQWALADLGGPVVTLAGDAMMEYRSTVSSPDRATTQYDLAYAATYAGVELGVADLWPRAGTVTYAIDARRERQAPNVTTARELTAEAVVTFEGEGRATLVLDELRSYRLDLQTGSVVAH